MQKRYIHHWKAKTVQKQNITLAWHRCGCMRVKQMDGYSYWMYRLWVCLQAAETVAIAAATRSPRALATSKGPTVSGKQEEAGKPVRKVTAAMKKTRVGRSRVRIPVPAKFPLAKSPLNNTCFRHCIHEDSCKCEMYNLIVPAFHVRDDNLETH